MADPVSLVSLGVKGARGLLSHRSAVRQRRRAIQTLVAELDAAHSTLLLAQYHEETLDIYVEVLAPIIEDGIAFLEGIRKRNRPTIAAMTWVQPRSDGKTAQALVKRFETANSEIELKVMALNVQLARTEISRISNTVVPETSARIILVQAIVMSCFFSCGEASVTPQDRK